MLLDEIEKHILRKPEKTALIYGDLRWSYAQFSAVITRTAQYLTTKNIRPGSIAILAVRDLVQSRILDITLRHLGITTLSVPTVQDIKALSLGDIETLITLQGESLGKLEPIAVSRNWAYVTAPIFEDAAINADELPPAALRPGGHILMTSGTTGRYKMILRDPVQEVERIPVNAHLNCISPESVVYVGDFPLMTAGGYGWPLLTWYLGGTVVLHQGEDALSVLLNCGATLAFATPGTLSFMLDAPDQGWPRCEDLSLLVTGASLPQVLAKTAQARITPEVYSLLASSEAGNFALTRFVSPDDLRWHQPIASREMQVVDDEDRMLPEGGVGLLRVRLLDGLDRYHDDPEASRLFFRGGWFYPGDLASFGPDGRLMLHGRSTDVLNVRGSKIAAAPLELELQNRLGAEGVCFISLPNDDEQIHVFIQPREPLQRQEVEKSIRNLLKFYRGIHLHIVEQLPRNHMGKIQRLILRQQLQQGKISQQPGV